MDLIYVALIAVVGIEAGSADNYGPLNSTIALGFLHSPSTENVVASRNLVGLLEYVRRLMPVGIADDIPPMEPYVKEVMSPASFHSLILRGEVELTNLVVSGAQDFTINDIQVQIDAERIDFDVTVPEVVADLDYNAVNLVYQNVFVFNVSGHVQIKLKNYNAVGALSAKSWVWSPHEAHYTVDGLYVENSADDVETEVPGSWLPDEVIEEIKDALFTSVAKTAMNEMDTVLIKFDTVQVLEFLKGDGSISKS